MTSPMLNRPLLLEERQRVADGAGGYTESWAPLGTLWAELKAGTGRERGEGMATLSLANYRITVRAAPQGSPSRPKPDQRFRDGTRIFRILAVLEKGTNGRFLQCNAVEEVVS
ncbi:MAG: phage head closure protein [Rhodobacteraceae bacterium]|nr:phage head closure protein [Paracoccaceae bacterium]